jgi:hypothetical protein
VGRMVVWLTLHVPRSGLPKDWSNGTKCGTEGRKSLEPRSPVKGENRPNVLAARRMDKVRWPVIRFRDDNNAVVEGWVIAETVTHVCRCNVTGH